MRAIDFLKEGDGVLRLKPTWVARSFCRPGKRIKLHPDDYYILGLEKGGIDERWFASTTWAENGPDTPIDEGLSYVVNASGDSKMLLRDMVEQLKGEVIGEYLWNKYGKWPMFSKFFDNLGPLPHHVHHRDEHAARVGTKGKPETYFYPAQMNNHEGEFGYTFFGLNPGTTKQELKTCLENFTKGDNHILDYSKAYKIELDTGWDVPPGLLHAPASLCTYEPQFACDVYAMYQSVLLGGHCVPENLLWKNCPEEEIGNYDYLVDVVDWELNVDPNFKENRFMRPIVARCDDRYKEEWICYKSKCISAKRLTVYPGQEITLSDGAAYGFILIEGYGKFGVWDIETPTLIRYNELTNDEFFVTESRAKSGVKITNKSKTENLVMLKHFAENPDLELLKL